MPCGAGTGKPRTTVRILRIRRKTLVADLVRAAAGPADEGAHPVTVSWWDGEVRRARLGPEGTVRVE